MAALFEFFRRGLQKSATKITRTFGELLGGIKVKNAADFEELEAALVAADFGVKAAHALAADLRDRYERGVLKTDADLQSALRDEISRRLKNRVRPIRRAEKGSPSVYLFVGVNGSGKTTSIGKLARSLIATGNKVILGACDTFRAAAVEQLQLWGERTGAEVVSSRHGADPASVAFDAVSAARSRGADFLLIDTAGRQQNQKSLMDELAKIRRSIAKIAPDAPHEVLMTVDASLGANVLSQAREFSAACGVTGLVLTKIDGTGRGGMAVALNEEFSLPTFYVGMGEAPEDLREFDPDAYADALFAGDGK
ncbi:MAG: signal recognition particle-docking protein FtsY [Victivallaceae bacterium]|nr:signal recognition particle-docking protein FtsY [Victivallaceae bacterium]